MDPVAEVEELHRAIDERVSELERMHRGRIRCRRGCSSCCVDDITVFEVEAEVIRRHHPNLLSRGEPHPPGACAFLDEDGACRIYAQRPYVCRTQGVPLRWLEGEDAVEYRDICELNDGEPLITDLFPDECWTIGPVEIRLQHHQREAHPDGELCRVRLRDLFESQEPELSKTSTSR